MRLKYYILLYIIIYYYILLYIIIYYYDFNNIMILIYLGFKRKIKNWNY